MILVDVASSIVGTFGKVKIAVNKLTGQEVAVKIVDKIHAPTVIREIETLRKLRHPNIAQLYEVLTTESKIYLVTEYVSGGEIFEHIESNGPMSEGQAKLIFIQLLDAIQYCHDKKVVHRDLKLENIMMDSNMNPKIIDFGFTREVETKDKLLETYCGSVAYASPEMVSGQKYSGPEADIWSLGVILYTMVCGYLPFDDDVESRVHAKIMNLEYDVPDFVTDSCVDLIGKILQLDPKNRISVQKMLEHAWLKDAKENLKSKIFNEVDGNSSAGFRTASDSNTIVSPSPTKSTPVAYTSPVSRTLSPLNRGYGDNDDPLSPLRASPGIGMTRQRQNDLQDFLTNRSADEKILLYHLALMGFDVFTIIKSVKEEACDQSSGIFFLLLAKMRKSPLITSSAVLSALSTPAMSAQEQLNIFNSLYHGAQTPSTPEAAVFSPVTDTAPLSSGSSYSTGQIMDFPASWHSAINERAFAMVKLSTESNVSAPRSSSASGLLSNHSISNSNTVEDLRLQASMSQVYLDSSDPLGHYFGHLSKMTSSNSILFSQARTEAQILSPPGPTSPPQQIPRVMLQNEMGLFNNGDPAVDQQDLRSKDELSKASTTSLASSVEALNSSKSHDSVIAPLDDIKIELRPPSSSGRRASAPDLEQVPSEGNQRRTSANLKKKQLNSPSKSLTGLFAKEKETDQDVWGEIGDVNDMREFRDKRSSRKQATISEEEEEDSSMTITTASKAVQALKINTETNASSNEDNITKSPLTRIGGIFKTKGTGLATRFRNAMSPVSPLKASFLNEMIKSPPLEKETLGSWEASEDVSLTRERSSSIKRVSTTTTTTITVEEDNGSKKTLSNPRLGIISEATSSKGKLISRQSSQSSITERADGSMVTITTSQEIVTFEDNGKRIRKTVKEERRLEECDDVDDYAFN